MKIGDKVKLSWKYKRYLCRLAFDGDNWSKRRLELRKNAVGVVAAHSMYSGFNIEWDNGETRHHNENELTLFSQ
jgi:hypothetical protein